MQTLKTFFNIKQMQSIKVYLINKFAKYKSKSIFPDNIDFDFNDILQQRKIRIAIIDDNEFIWINALNDIGCHVEYFDDYTKKTSNPTKKLTAHNFEKFDIILCDIGKIGTLVYPGIDGIGVIKKLRETLPFHVIAAYTGSPALTITKLNKNTLDFVFPKEMDLDDFLLNIKKLINIFKYPKDRWKFIRTRLQYLGISEEHELLIRRAFVEYILSCRYLNKLNSLSSNEMKNLIINADKSINMLDFVDYGVAAGKVMAFIIPMAMGKD